MKFKEWIEELNKFLKENPEIENYEVITAVDPEGNGYYEVDYLPTIGQFEEGEFISKEDVEYCETPNAVCVN